MEYIPLVLDGLENKVKKLVFINQQLKEENKRISNQKINLDKEIAELKKQISDLNHQNNTLKVSGALTGRDTLQARQQINELLREIDKCYSLLNR
jgi:SMC interacting uncharacterized protein involved in chromosome segregation